MPGPGAVHDNEALFFGVFAYLCHPPPQQTLQQEEIAIRQ